MLLGAIDIGSNAVRLYFSNVSEQDGRLQVRKVSLTRIPLRLGDDVFENNEISEKKICKLIKTIKAFRLLIEVNSPVAYRACATSAMREASNGKEIISRIAEEAGVQVEIINGVEEARILTAVHNLEEVTLHEYSLYIDVGGGSTELSVMSTRGVIASTSFRIGTVRMLSNKVKEKEWGKMYDWLMKHEAYFSKMLFVGAGGNINTLAKLYGRLPEKILPLTNLEYALRQLKGFTLQQRIELLELKPDRADVIVPAATIFHYIMKTTGAKTLLVPRIGLSDGMVSLLYNEVQKTVAG